MSEAEPFLQAQWPAPGRVRAFTTLRHGAGVSQAPFDAFNLGSRCGDNPEAVRRNRDALLRAGGLPSAPHWLQQVHGTEVARIGTDAPREEPEADASVTDVSGAVLAILTADCLPVVFADKAGGEVAAAHAGWRGLAAGVLENTIAAMRSDSAQLIAWLGPAAGSDAYEIGEEVRSAFVDRDPRTAPAFRGTRPGHWCVDLYALARMRLADAGIAPGDIHGGGLCTISDPQRFYSHRRSTAENSGLTGRMATLVWMEPR